ncbi:MAG: hypothetical protein JEY91_01745 [Spirochaetaceae bacterium]|nr:hypothetical protein [Spirochaetaceae bacterium]
MSSKIRYRCQYCNKMVTFGKHDCRKEPEDKIHFYNPISNNWKGLLSRLLVVTIVSLLISGLLFNHIGYYSFLLMIIFMALSFFLKDTNLNNISISRRDYKKLLKLNSHNKELTERLIDLEKNKYGSLSRNECIKKAYERLLYERSR